MSSSTPPIVTETSAAFVERLRRVRARATLYRVEGMWQRVRDWVEDCRYTDKPVGDVLAFGWCIAWCVLVVTRTHAFWDYALVTVICVGGALVTYTLDYLFQRTFTSYARTVRPRRASHRRERQG